MNKLDQINELDHELLPSSTYLADDSHQPADRLSVLIVDLDGTLIRTDLLHEALIRCTVNAPVTTARLMFRLFEGRAAFKQALAENCDLDVTTLPFRKNIVDFITAEKSKGRVVVLATASCREWAEAVAEHLQIFDDILASDGQRNLKGGEKLAAIKEYCQQHGHREFAYIGDSQADIPIWEEAAEIFFAKHNTRLFSSLKRRRIPIHTFDKSASLLVAPLSLLRPHQWAKNTLLFVPLLFSHQIGDFGLLFKAIIAVISFCLFASGVYVLNDIVDVGFDRRHDKKRNRPFASGDVPISAAVPLAGVAFLLGTLSAYLFLPVTYVAVLFAYIFCTTLYTLVIKRVMIADVMMLASLYVLRVFAGGIACNIAISDWLLTFSLFIFVSLGCLKRYVELTRLSDAGLPASTARGYEVTDLGLLETMGISCGMMSVVVLAFYLQSEHVRSLYHSSKLLWLLCPILMYWLCRAWILARRRSMSDDPIAFALTDGPSLTVVAVTLSLLAMASQTG
jgi:4-hydroxybenzoate polyprenyltransferase/phosphoserine phosphatase